MGGAMNLAEFRDLCRREWGNGNGDVRDLWLVADSYRELGYDAQQHGAKGETDIYFDEDDARDMAGQKVTLNVLANPVTLTVVKMHIARDLDVADVWYPDGHFETRLLDQAKARELGIQVS
jgi:hypothetical protein